MTLQLPAFLPYSAPSCSLASRCSTSCNPVSNTRQCILQSCFTHFTLHVPLQYSATSCNPASFCNFLQSCTTLQLPAFLPHSATSCIPALLTLQLAAILSQPSYILLNFCLILQHFLQSCLPLQPSAILRTLFPPAFLPHDTALPAILPHSTTSSNPSSLYNFLQSCLILQLSASLPYSITPCITGSLYSISCKSASLHNSLKACTALQLPASPPHSTTPCIAVSL